MVRVDLENKFDKLGEVTDGLLESEEIGRAHV